MDVPAWDDSMVALTEVFKNTVAPGSNVLDYGCGHGNFVLDELKGQFGVKTGTDVDGASVTGNISVDKTIICKDDSLPFPDETFSAVISLWVFEHVADPEKTFAEIARVLTPGGTFAFVTPNKNSFLILLRRMINKKLADKILKVVYGREEEDVFEVYYRTNSISQIKKLAKAHGFKIEMLRVNADPSYTSFNGFTYTLSRLFSALPIGLSKPHLIGVLKKTENRP